MRGKQPTEKIEVEYRGKSIVYDQTSDTWKCSAAAIEAPTLGKVKAEIDKASKKQRRLNVPALLLTRDYSLGHGLRDMWKVAAVTIEMLALPEENFCGPPEIKQAHIKTDDGREKVNISSLYPVECKAELEAAVTAENTTNAAYEKARNARGEIKRFHLKDLQAIAGDKLDAEESA